MYRRYSTMSLAPSPGVQKAFGLNALARGTAGGRGRPPAHLTLEGIKGIVAGCILGTTREPKMEILDGPSASNERGSESNDRGGDIPPCHALPHRRPQHGPFASGGHIF